MIILPLVLLLTPSSDTTRARVVATIGEGSPSVDYAFGKVSGMTFDAAGRLYVTDFQDALVVVFGPTGAKMGVVGRKGDGPGEFRAPTGPLVGPDGALYVRNLVFIQRYTADPATGVLARFDHNLQGPPMAPWMSPRATFIDSARRVYFPMEWGDGRTHVEIRSFARYDGTGRLLDTLPVPQYPTELAFSAFVMTGPGGGKLLAGLNAAPFEPRTVWAVTPAGTVVSGDGKAPTLQETDRAGKVLRAITIGGVDRRIPGPERAESLAALRRRIDSLPIPIDRVIGVSEAVRTQRLPESYPAATGLLVVGAELWVRRWPVGGHTWFDRFTLAGAPRGTLDLPASCAAAPMPVVRDRRIACLTVDPESGAESVTVMELPR